MNWPETMMQEEASVHWCLSLQQHSFLKGRKKTEEQGQSERRQRSNALGEFRGSSSKPPWESHESLALPWVSRKGKYCVLCTSFLTCVHH